MKMNVTRNLTTGAVLLLSSSKIWASGLSIQAQSASSLGTAGASDTAGNQEISAIFSNPASIGAFKGQRLSIGIVGAKTSMEFKDGARTYPITGTPVTTKDESTSVKGFGKDPVGPVLFGVHQVNENVNFGWSVTAPFETYSDYGSKWIGRYHAIKTDLQVLNLDLGGSYRIADDLIFGFGIQVQKANGSLSGASNIGAAGAAKLVNGVKAAFGNAEAVSKLSDSGKAIAQGAEQAYAAAAAAAIAANKIQDEVTQAGKAAAAEYLGATLNTLVTNADGTADVIADYQGSNVAAGFNFGVLYSPLTDLTLGLSYRSQVKHKNKGDIEFTGDSAAAQGYIAAQQFDKKASLNITLPDSISLATAYRGIENLTLFANLTQTRWSSLEALDLRYTSGTEGAKNIYVKLDWQDSLYAGVGAAYKLSPEIQLRAGAALDKSPTLDNLRSPRSPDNDRTLLSLGAAYAQDNWQVDLGLTHTALKAPTLDLKEADYPEALLRGDLNGKYSVSANTVMVQYSQSI